MWDQPRPIKSFEVDGDYDKGLLHVPAIKVDFGGPRMELTAKGRKGLLPGHDLDFEFGAKLFAWPDDQFGQLWPKTIIPDTREWMAANLSKGMYDHAEATF